MSFNEKRFTAVFGALVFLLAVSGYLITVAPTVSFWDCGEFIACSYSMGIPHPPGTPLFVIIGRVVCLLLSFIREIAYRINLISVFANSVTVTLCYLIIVRLLRHWFKPEEEENFFMKFLPIVGGFTGALFTAFSYTWWFNCVEAEVYGIAMLIMVTELWLGFKWQDYRGTPHADRILILIMYLAYLGIGAHLYTMIPVPLIFLYVALQDEEKRKSWQLWLIGFCLLSVMYSISSFLTIGPLLLLYCILWILLEEDTAKKVNGIFLAVVSLYSLKNALPAQDKEFSGLGFILGLVYMALAVLPFVLKTEAKDVERHKWSFCFYIVLFAFLGYSVNFFIPVRSYLDPIIDENNPEVVIEKASDLLDGKKWEQLIYFLERKQYGNESMIMRMFHRRGAFFSQFINHQHMGFGGYLAVQFFNFNDISAGELRLGDNTLVRMGKLLLYLLPLFFVIWAVSYQYRRNRNGTLFLGMALFACTIGLVLYMNFADGTVPEQRDLIQWEKNGRAGPKPEPIQMEVRERDYFFTPGFM
ncbi:MAG: DUF2723 domain-containing protein, partial [Deltaproteobacteria bacterium]